MAGKSILFTQNLKKVLKSQREVESAAKFIGQFTNSIILNAKEKGRLQAMMEVFEHVEELNAVELEKNEKKGTHKISCRMGCNFCCHLEVDMTNIEAEAIIDYCKKNEIEIPYSHFQKQAHLNTSTRAYSEHSKCGFLGENGLCSIYPVRPLSCRNYHVSNEPELCDTKKYPEGETTVIQFNESEAIMCALLTYSNGKYGNMQTIFLNKRKV